MNILPSAVRPSTAIHELRLSRLGAFDAALSAIRAAAEADAARKAGDHYRAGRHERLATSYRALRDLYQQRERDLAQAMTDRQEWEHATTGTRNLAIAADADATQTRTSSPCAPPNRSPPPALSAIANSPKRARGVATLQRSARHSARNSTNDSIW